MTAAKESKAYLNILYNKIFEIGSGYIGIVETDEHIKAEFIDKETNSVEPAAYACETDIIDQSKKMGDPYNDKLMGRIYNIDSKDCKDQYAIVEDIHAKVVISKIKGNKDTELCGGIDLTDDEQYTVVHVGCKEVLKVYYDYIFDNKTKSLVCTLGPYMNIMTTECFKSRCLEFDEKDRTVFIYNKDVDNTGAWALTWSGKSKKTATVILNKNTREVEEKLFDSITDAFNYAKPCIYTETGLNKYESFGLITPVIYKYKGLMDNEGLNVMHKVDLDTDSIVIADDIVIDKDSKEIRNKSGQIIQFYDCTRDECRWRPDTEDLLGKLNDSSLSIVVVNKNTFISIGYECATLGTICRSNETGETDKIKIHHKFDWHNTGLAGASLGSFTYTIYKKSTVSAKTDWAICISRVCRNNYYGLYKPLLGDSFIEIPMCLYNITTDTLTEIDYRDIAEANKMTDELYNDWIRFGHGYNLKNIDEFKSLFNISDINMQTLITTIDRSEQSDDWELF